MKSNKMLSLVVATFLCATSAHAQVVPATPAHQSNVQDYYVFVGDDGVHGIVAEIQERNGKFVNTRGGYGKDIKALDADTAARYALGACADSSGPGRPIADGIFMVQREPTFERDRWTVLIIRARPDQARPMSQEEQARFQAWERQWQPTPCVKDASLPMDTVRLKLGAESKIRPGYFFPKRPAKRPDYVPTEYIPAKVLRNDGKFLGWQYFAPAQLKYMHEQ
jgi:hypothetical protein